MKLALFAVVLVIGALSATCTEVTSDTILRFEQSSALHESNDFLKCMAKCLGSSIDQIIEWEKECKKDLKCWMQKAGVKAIQCSAECIKTEIEDALLVEEIPVEANKFVKCMAKCLGKSAAEVESWYKECKKNFKCWAKKVGKAALKCGPKCLLPFSVDEPQLDELENSAVTAGEVLEESPVAANKFVKCLAKCLGKSVAEIEKWYGECKKNIKCWAKKVGKAALKCGPKCLLPFSVDEPQLDELENSAVTAVEVVESPVEASKFVKCMAKCLGKSVADIENWYRECKKNFKCWAKKVGKAALKCGPKCLRPFSEDETTETSLVETSLEETSPAVVEDKVAGKFIACMALCLGKSVAEIKKWEKECKKNVKCWLKKVGKKALKCVPRCLLPFSEDEAATLENMYDTETSPAVVEDKIVGKFVVCMAKCVGKSVIEIKKWKKECKKNVKCWVKKVGKKALKCVPRCLLPFSEDEAATLENTNDTGLTVTSSRFEKCMATCLKKDLAQIIQWYEECKRDLKCWWKKVGASALVCVAECIKMQDNKIMSPTEEAVNTEAAMYMAQCLSMPSKDIMVTWFNACKYSATCWSETASDTGVQCIVDYLQISYTLL